MVYIILKVRIRKKPREKTKEAAEEEMSRVIPPPPPLTALRQTAEQGVEWVASLLKSLSPCRFWWRHFATHQRAHNTHWIWCRAEVTPHPPPNPPFCETQLQVISCAASSITWRNKHYNHVLLPSKHFLGTKIKSEAHFEAYLGRILVIGGSSQVHLRFMVHTSVVTTSIPVCGRVPLCLPNAQRKVMFDRNAMWGGSRCRSTLHSNSYLVAIW